MKKATPTPEQIAKLPKWAQEHIEDIEKELELSKRSEEKALLSLESIRSGTYREGASMFYRDHDNPGGSVVWLPPGVVVEWAEPDGDDTQRPKSFASAHANDGDGFAVLSTPRAMSVFPHSYNSISVRNQ